MNRLPLTRRAVWIRHRAGLPLVRLDAPGGHSAHPAPVRGIDASAAPAPRRRQQRRAA